MVEFVEQSLWSSAKHPFILFLLRIAVQLYIFIYLFLLIAGVKETLEP